MNIRNEKAITLIALVVTIVVLLILAGVSIAMLTGKNGIIQQATSSKKATAEESEIEEIKLAYTALSMNKKGKNVTDEELQKELDKNNDNITVTLDDNGGLYVVFNDTNNVYEINNSKVSKIEKIPEYEGLTITAETEGVIFKDKNGNAKALTDELVTGDVVLYGDYEYHYNQEYFNHPYSEGVFGNNEQLDGWSVKTIEPGKTEYGELCGNILGKKLKSIQYLFGGGVLWLANSKLISSPKIPYSVENMAGTFQHCESLVSAPIIPSSVKDMDYIFSSCNSLSGTIVINANPTEYSNWIGGNKELVKITGKSNMLQELLNAVYNVNPNANVEILE